MLSSGAASSSGATVRSSSAATRQSDLAGAQAILDGERYTGVSVMRVERAMDAGPVALARRLEIGAEETTGELTLRLSHLTSIRFPVPSCTGLPCDKLDRRTARS